MFTAAAIAAKGTSPDGVELLDERVDASWVIGQDAVLKVALALGLCTHPRASEIRRSEVHFHAIYDDALEVDSRTQHPFHRRPKHWIAIEVIPPIRS